MNMEFYKMIRDANIEITDGVCPCCGEEAQLYWFSNGGRRYKSCVDCLQLLQITLDFESKQLAKMEVQNDRKAKRLN